MILRTRTSEMGQNHLTQICLHRHWAQELHLERIAHHREPMQPCSSQIWDVLVTTTILKEESGCLRREK